MFRAACFASYHDRRAARCAHGLQSKRSAIAARDGRRGYTRLETLAGDAERRRRLWLLAARQRIVAIPHYSRGARVGPREAEKIRSAAGDVREVAEVFA